MWMIIKRKKVMNGGEKVEHAGEKTFGKKF